MEISKIQTHRELEKIIAFRNINAFISSTFQDLDDERNYLVKYIFPRVVDFCEQRYVSFRSIDLRWGITASQATEHDILQVCIDEIDRATPFFIGIIGGRYGWEPREADFGSNYSDLIKRIPWLRAAVKGKKSITEIEFLYGAILRESACNSAAFYIKDGVEVEQKAKVLRDKLDRLTNYHIRHYSSIQEFGELVYDDLTARINEIFPLNDYDALTREKRRHEYNLAKRTTDIAEIPYNYFEKLENWINGDVNIAILSEEVTIRNGRSNYTCPGKSTLLCGFIARKRDEGYYVIYVDVQVFNVRNDFVYEIFEFIKQQLGAIPQSTKVFLAVDNFDFYMNKEQEDGFIDYIRTISRNYKIIISTRHCGWGMRLDSQDLIYCAAPSAKYKMDIIDHYLACYGKKLSISQKEKIISCKLSENLRSLTYILMTLVRFGSFDNLDDEIEKYCKHRHVMEILLEDVRSNIGNMRHGSWEPMWILNAILFTGESGLTEKEIIDLSGINPLRWAQLRRRILELCICQGALYVIDDRPHVFHILRTYYYTNFQDMIIDKMKIYFATHDIPIWRRANIVPLLYEDYIGLNGEEAHENFKKEARTVFTDVELVVNMSYSHLCLGWSNINRWDVQLADVPQAWSLRKNNPPLYDNDTMIKYYKRLAKVTKDVGRIEDHIICLNRLKTYVDDEYYCRMLDLSILLINRSFKEAEVFFDNQNLTGLRRVEMLYKIARSSFECGAETFKRFYHELIEYIPELDKQSDLYYDVTLLKLEAELLDIYSNNDIDRARGRLKDCEYIETLDKQLKALYNRGWGDKRLGLVTRLIGYTHLILGNYHFATKPWLDHNVLFAIYCHSSYSVEYKHAMLDYSIGLLLNNETKLFYDHIKASEILELNAEQLCNIWIVNALKFIGSNNTISNEYQEKAKNKLNEILSLVEI